MRNVIDSHRFTRPIDSRFDGNTMTDTEIQKLISQGESSTVEFKTRITQSRILARNISAFANSDGGKILVGVDERRGIVGCDRDRLSRIFNEAKREIDGKVDLTLDFVDANKKTVGVISVGQAPRIVSSRDGIFSRVGAAAMAMQSLEIQKRIAPEESPIDKLSGLVSEQTKRIDDLLEMICKDNSWKSKVIDYLIGGLIGAAIGFLLTIAFT